jgi:hypothetical protein
MPTQGIPLSPCSPLYSLLSVIAFHNMLLAAVTPKVLVADSSILLHAEDFQSGPFRIAGQIAILAVAFFGSITSACYRQKHL